ncbi:MAG TPA: pilus assembly protein TadG-related protein [Phycisphaerae bacterium]|nr:pilus assembly protein TadG-related protein [Phycisphaerae bacterium]
MNPLKRFKSECKASVATVFAIALLPIMVGSGMAIDYSRAVSRRAALQNALDGAILAASRNTGSSMSDAQLKALIKNYIEKSEFGTEGLGTITLNRSGTVLNATAAAVVPTTIMQLVAIDDVNIMASTRASWADSEVVLVLDSSGTMSVSSKMANLRTAVSTFIDTVGGTDGSVRIGMMPFAVSARVDPADTTYRNATWILFNGNNFDFDVACTEDGEDGSCTYTSINKNTWTGCITDRLKAYDFNDTYYNSENLKKYPAIQSCRTGENLQFVQPLTTQFSALKTRINNLQAGGGTNLTIGVAWGHAMLSSIVPFQASAANPPPRKIIILVSGGAQTRSRHSKTAATLDARTRTACTSARNAGIEIYTVSYSLSTVNDQLMRDCATISANYFDAANSSDISRIFTELSRTIRQPKLTH